MRIQIATLPKWETYLVTPREPKVPKRTFRVLLSGRDKLGKNLSKTGTKIRSKIKVPILILLNIFGAMET